MVETNSEEVTDANITDRIHRHRDVFIVAGLVGAGKSTVAEMVAGEHDETSTVFEMSDFVRTKHEEEEGGRVSTSRTVEDANDVTADELGEWAAEQKDKHGRGYFARELAETVKSSTTPHVVISGVRSPEEVTAIEEVFDRATTRTAAVWTLPDIRFERKYGATPSVDHDEWETFKRRNERELWEWGCVELLAEDSVHEADYIIPNHGTKDELRGRVESMMNRRAKFRSNPFPSGDFETVAQYL